MNCVLQTKGLQKRYGSFEALSPTDLTVERGQIFGLVGQNGAGKTTLLKMITGQTMISGGELALFSESTPKGLLKMRRRLGAIVEEPAFYPYLTAEQNLEYYRIQRGVPGKACVGEALELVGLSDTGKKKFSQFSMGMKQRLGLALSILARPDLLLLDEPLNGLDPMGIVEMRRLILRLAGEQNITIVISSHILNELESVATNYGFIHQGTLLEQISAAELSEKCRRYMEIRVENTDQAAVVLERELGAAGAFEVLPGGLIHLYEYLDQPSKVSGILVNHGVRLDSLEVKGENLENYFVSLVGGERRA